MRPLVGKGNEEIEDNPDQLRLRDNVKHGLRFHNGTYTEVHTVPTTCQEGLITFAC